LDTFDVSSIYFLQNLILLAFSVPPSIGSNYNCAECAVPLAEASLLNKSLRLAAALGVTKFITVKDMILVTLCCST
jgi:hypothetical protein